MLNIMLGKRTEERFRFSRDYNTRLSLVDTQSPYKLHFDPDIWNELGPFYFTHGTEKNLPYFFIVTGRNLTETSPSLREEIENGFDGQLVEVGVGMSEFMSWYVSTNPTQKPRIIDNLNHRLAIEMLQVMMPRVKGKHRIKALELIGRMETYLDSEQVTLYNMKLGDALRRHSELLGSADIVVDFQGARRYHPTEFASGEKVVERELSLLVEGEGFMIQKNQ